MHLFLRPVQRLGELFRKLWNPHNFKAHVSPHEMLQAVASTSKKRFKITEQGESMCRQYNYSSKLMIWFSCVTYVGDPVDFLSWLLNTLHMALRGTKKSGSSELILVFL